jgi:hypothetical protein
MKKPLTPADWAALWKLRRAGFALDLLPHTTPRLELDVYPDNDQVLITSTDNFTWVQLSVALRASSLVSIVDAYLLIDSPAREFRSVPRDRIPTAVHRLFPRSRSKTFRFTVGRDSVLHVLPRFPLRVGFLLGGELELPILLPGQTLPAELWLRDRDGRYFGTGFPWRGGIELSAVTGDEASSGREAGTAGDQEESASRG